MIKQKWLTLWIIIFVLILAFTIIYYPKSNTPEEIAKCIGKNSIVYVQLGCHACKVQEEIFGDNYKYITQVDCVFEKEKCALAGITATPTWFIRDTKIQGAQTIEKLKELAGC